MNRDHLVRTFKPRRRGLSPARQARFEAGLGRWNLGEAGPMVDWSAVFGPAAAAGVVLEIGAGGGEAALAMALAQPDQALVAADVHTPGIAHLLDEIESQRLDNLRVMHGDALVFLDRVPSGSLAGVRIWFPDPWPKTAHHHRRIVRSDVVAAVADRLRPGGFVHCATDWPHYAAAMVRELAAAPALAGGVIERPPWRPFTRFESRGLEAGRPITDVWFERRK